jgi:hypothetical protein
LPAPERRDVSGIQNGAHQAVVSVTQAKHVTYFVCHRGPDEIRVFGHDEERIATRRQAPRQAKRRPGHTRHGYQHRTLASSESVSSEAAVPSA